MEKILTRLDKHRTTLLSAINPIDDKAFARRPTEGEWSIAEIIYHLTIIEERVLKELIKQCANPKPLSFIGRLLQVPPSLVGMRLIRVRAPKFAEPLNPPSRSQNMANFERVRNELRTLIQQQGRSGLLNIYTKSIIGNFGGVNTVEFVGYHEVRHFKQIQETIPKVQ